MHQKSREQKHFCSRLRLSCVLLTILDDTIIPHLHLLVIGFYTPSFCQFCAGLFAVRFYKIFSLNIPNKNPENSIDIGLGIY